MIEHGATASGGIGTTRNHPRTLGWVGTTALALGGSNQSLFLIGALIAGQEGIPGQGTAAIPLLMVGLLLGWMAMPGWTELVLMWPNRVGGIAATCGEAFRPYSAVLANLAGVSYWWGWVPTCGLTALLSASAIRQWFLPGVPASVLACGLVCLFVGINLCGVKWAARLAIAFASVSAALAFLTSIIPVAAGRVDWHRAVSFHLNSPFPGLFGKVTSLMAGLYLVGFAAPAFEAAACHVGETINPARNIPRAMFASALMATVYFLVLPIVWLGMLGPESLTGDLAITLGPTFAPLLGSLGKAAAIWFMMFNMFHGTLAPLTGVARTLSQLAEDGLLPEFFAKRTRRDCPWVAISLTGACSIVFLLLGDPLWMIAAANFTYLIGISLPSIAVWLLRRDQPAMHRPYRAPRGTITLGLIAAIVWGISTVLGFQQFGLPTVIFGLVLAYSGSALYAWRKWSDRKKSGTPGVARSLHLKLTGAMLLVLTLDGAGYLMAVKSVGGHETALLAGLQDVFVAVAMLTISVGLVLPGMIAHSAEALARAAERLASGTLTDFSKAMLALSSGDLESAHATVDLVPVVIHSRDEVGEILIAGVMEHVARAATGLDGAREGLRVARNELRETNANLEQRVTDRTKELQESNQSLGREINERTLAAETIERLSRHNRLILESAGEGIFGLDLNGHTTFINPAGARLLGYDAAELAGQTQHDLIHYAKSDGSPYPRCECPIYAAFRDGKTYQVANEVFWRKDGTNFPVEYISTPIWEGGLVAGCVVVFKNITERMRAEADQRRRLILEASHTDLERRVAERTAELGTAHKKLIVAARQAGMAEVAIGVLHNVGNVLNSVNVSATIVASKLRHSKVDLLKPVIEIIEEHPTDLAEFIGADRRGQLLPRYLCQLSKQIVVERRELIEELSSLTKNVDHIKQIVNSQQSNSRSASLSLEVVDLAEVMDDAIRINDGALQAAHVEIGRLYDPVPPNVTDRHQVLQILVNLIRNAGSSLGLSGHGVHKLVARIRLSADSSQRLLLEVTDNGIGIPAENLPRIFEHGFTTKSDGHGFGLHTSALAAQTLGGSLRCLSDGLDTGATFTLELPLVCADDKAAA